MTDDPARTIPVLASLDIAATRDFYVGMLGFAVGHQDAGYLILRRDAMELHFWRTDDRRFRSLEGGDITGWHNVYTQKWPNPPQEFTMQDSRIGQVLADKNGMTLYVYQCGDDALDQLSCDHPTNTQAYRLAICGNGDPAVCNKTFAYVPAPRGAKINNMIWGTSWIDPQTGKLAKPDAPGAQLAGILETLEKREAA